MALAVNSHWDAQPESSEESDEPHSDGSSEGSDGLTDLDPAFASSWRTSVQRWGQTLGLGRLRDVHTLAGVPAGFDCGAMQCAARPSADGLFEWQASPAAEFAARNYSNLMRWPGQAEARARKLARRGYRVPEAKTGLWQLADETI